jgi:hypothetical protein
VGGGTRAGGDAAKLLYRLTRTTESMSEWALSDTSRADNRPAPRCDAL